MNGYSNFLINMYAGEDDHRRNHPHNKWAYDEG